MEQKYNTQSSEEIQNFFKSRSYLSMVCRESGLNYKTINRVIEGDPGAMTIIQVSILGGWKSLLERHEEERRAFGEESQLVRKGEIKV